MRFIDKRTVCKALQQRRHNQPQTDVDAKKAWRRFNKQAIRKACYKQQRGLCAYTELSLDDEQLGCHLEHIAPRSRYPERTFEMDNIILASLDDRYSGTLEINEQFGGHFKKARYEDEWFISPFDARCEQFFQYCSETGRVSASNEIGINDQVRTTKTIEVLNLNCAYLVEMRQQHLQKLHNEIHTIMKQVSLSLKAQQERFESLKRASLESNDNKLPIFFSAKTQLFERIGKANYQKTLHH